MVLYRPFIHHILRSQQATAPEMHSFACASACIKAAMQIVWIIGELDRRNLLIGVYWFTVYITFFAVMALCLFIIGNPDDVTVDDTLTAIETGRNVLSRLALENVSAERCVASLGVRVSPFCPLNLYDILTNIKPLFDRISRLCIERRRSRKSVTESLPSALETPSSFLRNLDMTPASPNFRSHDEISKNPHPGAATFSTFGSLPSVQSMASIPEEQLSNRQQHDLLAMMPLDDVLQANSPLDLPMYTNNYAAEENYFPYFSADWGNQIPEQ